MSVTRDAVLEVLKTIKEPGVSTQKDILSADRVRALQVDAGVVRFVLEIKPEQNALWQAVCTEAEARLKALDGVKSVSIVMTAHAPGPSLASPPSSAALRGAAGPSGAPPDLRAARKKPSATAPEPIAGVRHIIAVASGKGGVGKSTVSSNLACALAAEGRRVGLLDADVHGPSQPRMMGVSGRPASPDGKQIIPLHHHGVTLMSLGLMMQEDQAVIWRGPMLMGALQQMLRQVEWGALDVLVVDLPPGTGDVQLSLAQKTQLDGAIIVSTPQDVALLDARKAIDMFRKLGTRVLGMVENMSTYVCSVCGHEEHIFGHGGVQAEAAKLGVPLMAEIPLHLDVRLASDEGTPIVVSHPDSPAARAFRTMAQGLMSIGVA